MKKVQNSKNKLFLLFSGLAMAFICSLSGFSTPVIAENTPAPTAVLINSIGVTAYDRDQELLTTIDTGVFQSRNYKGYSWQDIEKVVINYIEEGEIPSADEYNYFFKAEYRQTYISDTSSFEPADNKTTIENIYSGTVTDLGEIGDLEFYIDSHVDDANLTDPAEKEHKNYGIGWGMYRFTLEINRQEIVSDYVVVKPTVPDSAPQVEYKTASSHSGLQNAYSFEITNDNKYSFADKNLIVWYVRGESLDGVQYVLTVDDLSLDEFSEYSHAVYTGQVERNGTTFFFDSQGIQGSWEVYCVVYDVDKTTVKFSSPINTVTTGKKIEASILIWILISAGLVLLGLIIFIIIRTVKKEKVW